jgi:hypothetical protein
LHRVIPTLAVILIIFLVRRIPFVLVTCSG